MAEKMAPVRLDDSLVNEARKVAAEQRRTLRSVFEIALEDYILKARNQKSQPERVAS